MKLLPLTRSSRRKGKLQSQAGSSAVYLERDEKVVEMLVSFFFFLCKRRPGQEQCQSQMRIIRYIEYSKSLPLILFILLMHEYLHYFISFTGKLSNSLPTRNSKHVHFCSVHVINAGVDQDFHSFIRIAGKL